MPTKRLEPPGCLVAVILLGMIIDALAIAAGVLWLASRLP